MRDIFFSQTPMGKDGERPFITDLAKSEKSSSPKRISISSPVMQKKATSLNLPKREVASIQLDSQAPLGQNLSLTSNIDAKTYSPDEYLTMHPELKAIYGTKPSDTLIYEANSKFPNEKNISYFQLSTQCPDLDALKFPVALRVNGNGNVIEAVPLFPSFDQSSIPSSILNCKIEGGGNEPFVTTSVPGLH